MVPNSVNRQINAGVTVTNTHSGISKTHLIGQASTSAVASAIQQTAAEAGLSASLIGGDAVRICGLNNQFSITNGTLSYRKEN